MADLTDDALHEIAGSLRMVTWNETLDLIAEVRRRRQSASVGGSERIVRAAIEDEDGAVWSLPPPARHGHIIKLMYEVKGTRHKAPSPERQGFLTSEGRFINRREALAIATAAGQIIRRSGNPDDPELYSEDVWC